MSGHPSEEIGGRYREETFPECLFSCQILCWHYTSQVFIPLFSQWSCELGNDTHTHTHHHIGSPLMRIGEVKYVFLDSYNRQVAHLFLSGKKTHSLYILPYSPNTIR